MHVYGARKTDCEPTHEQLSVNDKEDISQLTIGPPPVLCPCCSSVLELVGKRGPLSRRFSFSVLWAVTFFAPSVFFFFFFIVGGGGSGGFVTSYLCV